MSPGKTRSYNTLLSGISFIASSITKRQVVYGMPPNISFELTNYCNLLCPECASGSGSMKRERGFLDIELFNKVISELRPYLFNVNLYFQGEPMMHPQFFLFLENRGEYRTIVSTNGHFLSEENAEKIVKSGLSKLVVSLDGVTRETYSQYRIKGDIDKVIKGLQFVSYLRKKYKSPLKIEIQFLVNKINEHQIKDIRKFAAEIHAGLKLKSMQVIRKEDIEKWMPADPAYQRYKEDGEVYKIKNSMPDRCSRLWFNPVVTWDGKVVPCCFDKDGEFIMGDLFTESFRTIWKGPRYNNFRKNLLSGRSKIEICRNCTSGMKGVRF